MTHATTIDDRRPVPDALHRDRFETFDVWERRDVGSDWGPLSASDRWYYLDRIELGFCPRTLVVDTVWEPNRLMSAAPCEPFRVAGPKGEAR